MAAAGHSLVFKVMRLCRPAVQSDEGVKLTAGSLFGSSPAADSGGLPTSPFASRTLVDTPSDASCAQGLLLLPQSFGYESSRIRLNGLASCLTNTVYCVRLQFGLHRL